MYPGKNRNNSFVVVRPSVSTADFLWRENCIHECSVEENSLDNDDEANATDVAEEILDYLKSHPRVADTLDGVTRWWLLRQRYLRGLNQVESALEDLVTQGLVEKRLYSHGTVVYAATLDNLADNNKQGRQ